MTSDALHPIIKSQLHVSLAILKGAIEKCPDEVWLEARSNRYWQTAPHEGVPYDTDHVERCQQ